MQRTLAAMPAVEIASQSAHVCEQFLTLEHDGRRLIAPDAVVMMYLCKADAPEIDLGAFIHAHAARGGTVCAPRVDWDTGTMVPLTVATTDEPFVVSNTEIRRFGVPEPLSVARNVDPESLHVVLVPGLAFDGRCNRLGRGGGFYDRFLGSLAREKALQLGCGTRSEQALLGQTGNNGLCRKPLLVGVCFDRQIVSHVPTERRAHDGSGVGDIAMDVVVSSGRVIHAAE